MNLLFIKPKYIGDTLLLTGTLRAVKQAHPECRITVVTRAGATGILAGCPEIDRIVVLPGSKARATEVFRFVLGLRREKFDTAFELSDGDRGRILAMLSGAKSKAANSHPVHMKSAFWRAYFGERIRENYNTPGIPRSRWDFNTVAAGLRLALADTTPIFDRSRADFSVTRLLSRRRPTLFVHPTASVAANMWPAEKWIRFIRDTPERFDILLSCGPAEHEVAYCEKIRAGVMARAGVGFTGGKLSWAEMAGALYSSVAYIGADTAAMHLASACRLPILGIFGRNAPEHLAQWTPTGDRVRVVTFHGDETGIADIPQSRVTEAFAELFILS